MRVGHGHREAELDVKVTVGPACPCLLPVGPQGQLISPRTLVCTLGAMGLSRGEAGTAPAAQSSLGQGPRRPPTGLLHTGLSADLLGQSAPPAFLVSSEGLPRARSCPLGRPGTAQRTWQGGLPPRARPGTETGAPSGVRPPWVTRKCHPGGRAQPGPRARRHLRGTALRGACPSGPSTSLSLRRIADHRPASNTRNSRSRVTALGTPRRDLKGTSPPPLGRKPPGGPR